MSNNNGNGSRWWEFNLVRYFLGTLVGSFIVYLLFNSFVDGLEGKFKYTQLLLCEFQNINEKYNQLFFLGAGFIFCYFSSAPILVFHSSRFILKNNTKKIKMWFLILVGLMITLIFLFLWFSKIRIECKILIVLSTFFVIQLLILIPSFHKKTIFTYRRLTRNRESTSSTLNNNPNGRNTYVESYKHLREHGNAFFIVILEIILGLMLYQIKTPELMIICLLIWIFPGALIWFFGNYLESDLT